MKFYLFLFFFPLTTSRFCLMPKIKATVMLKMLAEYPYISLYCTPIYKYAYLLFSS